MNRPLGSELHPSILGQDHIPAALELCRFAGWNQTKQDWQRFLRLNPKSCFGLFHDQNCIATCISTEYARQQAWIGMMLVHPEYRRQGLAKRLLNHCLSRLDEQGIACVRLDATPAGLQVYQGLGFVPEFVLSRWRLPEQTRDVSRTNPKPRNTRKSSEETSYRKHLELDKLAFGSDRSELLADLAGDSLICSADNGFGMMRAGHLANYLGPLTAKSPGVAKDVVSRLLDATPGAIFWDIPDSQMETTQFAHSLGFQKDRSLTRMRRGKNVPQDVNLMYGISGPSTG